jgi:hypothetical protein
MGPIDIARSFAERGFTVFPLYPGKGGKLKRPFGWAGNEVVEPEKVGKVIPATNDPVEVDGWAAKVKSKYGSRVAGFGVLGLDCLIVDLDLKDGRNGVESFKELMAKEGIPKPRMVTLTKSGGLHCYYKRPASLASQHVKTLSDVSVKGVKYPGIDVRGNGGFVVGPTSLVESFECHVQGEYWCRGLTSTEDLPEFPESVAFEWVRRLETDDLERIASLAVSDDFMAQIRRGVIPAFVPKGSRNEAFFVFASVLKSRGVPVAVARQMMIAMSKNVEEPESFSGSVDIEDMLSRVFVTRKNNPYDVAVDLIERGLYQLTSHRSKLCYVILEENPYVASKSPHDEQAMKTLLKKFQTTVEDDKGKTQKVNPLDVVTKIIGDENRADYMGFKPNAGAVFTVHDDPGSRKFLNTYRPIIVPDKGEVHGRAWSEFVELVTRIFGPKDSPGYQLGMDYVAWLVQKPEIKPSVAPFVISYNRGVGKSLFFNVLTQILGTSKDGEKQGRLIKIDEITGRFFNPTGCVVNLLDEVQFPVHRDMRKESVTFWRHLKNLITAEIVSVEIKGGATYQLPNSAAIMLAGNAGNSFPVEEFDRRLWVVDANSPLLEKGTCDTLFELIKGLMGPDDRQRVVYELRDGLRRHKIQLDLSSMRAPMTEAKKELFMSSLTVVEEWFVTYFESKENMFSATPVITQSAFTYVANAMDPVRNSKFKEDAEGLWRDLKRRGYLRPIRSKSNPHLSRQLSLPKITSDGNASQSDAREIAYTTRDHGSMDSVENKDVVQAFIRNANTVKEFRAKFRQRTAQEGFGA